MRTKITTCIIFAMLSTISCNNTKETNKVMDIQSVPVNYELSFNVYNKKRLDEFSPPSSLSKDSLTRIINSMIEDLETYTPDTTGEYYEHYKKYKFIPLTSYVKSANAAKEDLKRNLDKKKSMIANGNIKNDGLSMVDHYYFVKSCNEMFKNDWPISPSLYFSNQLIDSVLKNSRELLFNQYLYDSDPKNQYHLPVINKLDVGDDSVVKPHYIDIKNAKELLKELNKYEAGEEILRQEIQLFKELLNKVINGDIVLALNNHSM